MLKAEILCVGTELLLGDIVNTNAAFLARQLAQAGVAVYHQAVVGDNDSRLREALSQALEQNDLVVLTGGLGPTYDDMTKETVADYFGLPMEENKEALEQIKAFFARIDRPMTDNNKKQALVPKGAQVLQNHHGTAPGVWVERDGKAAILLPGPPREMQPMFLESVLPRLQSRTGQVILSHTLHLFGMGESQAEQLLRPLMLASQNPTLAPYAKDGEVQLRVTARASNAQEAEQLMAPLLEQVPKLLGPEKIYGLDVGTLQNALVQALTKASRTIAVAESCTGGLLAKRITEIPGASQVFGFGAVTYSCEAKERMLGVSGETLSGVGAVSAEAAREMAAGVRALSGADIGLSVTGNAGPASSEGKPVGLVYIGVASPAGVRHLELHLDRGRPDDREMIRVLSSSHALYQALQELRMLSFA